MMTVGLAFPQICFTSVWFSGFAAISEFYLFLTDSNVHAETEELCLAILYHSVTPQIKKRKVQLLRAQKPGTSYYERDFKQSIRL